VTRWKGGGGLTNNCSAHELPHLASQVPVCNWELEIQRSKKAQRLAVASPHVRPDVME
jgi:hypothetical protein